MEIHEVKEEGLNRVENATNQAFIQNFFNNCMKFFFYSLYEHFDSDSRQLVMTEALPQIAVQMFIKIIKNIKMFIQLLKKFCIDSSKTWSIDLLHFQSF